MCVCQMRTCWIYHERFHLCKKRIYLLNSNFFFIYILTIFILNTYRKYYFYFKLLNNISILFLKHIPLKKNDHSLHFIWLLTYSNKTLHKKLYIHNFFFFLSKVRHSLYIGTLLTQKSILPSFYTDFTLSIHTKPTEVCLLYIKEVYKLLNMSCFGVSKK